MVKMGIPTPNPGGYTLIELLVVIVIVTILATIALPSMLNQAAKARQSEAKAYIGAINRAQQVNYVEEQRFSISLEDLELGIPLETENFTYSITNLVGQQPASNDPSYREAIVSWALAKDEGVRHYLGLVDVISTSGGVGSLADLMCESHTTQTGTIDPTAYTQGKNYTVVTNNGDSTQRPTCVSPFYDVSR